MSNSINVKGDAETLIKDELNKFVLTYTGQDALSAIDEIALSYMVSILESLGSTESPQDAFDVDEFSEMMSAYIPAFTNINGSDICNWMFNLAEWLKKSGKQNGEQKPSLEERFSYLSQFVSLNISSESVLSSSPHSSASSSRSRSTSQSEDEERNINHTNQIIPSTSQELELLTEMFPHMSIVDLQLCINMVNGDCEKAVQLILQKQESGQQIITSLMTTHDGKCTSKTAEYAAGDKKLRESILNKYGYIDQDDDAREHKPVAPKPEPKKLIRYRDSKIVSVKGERFSEVKTEDGDAPKKTFISLKPARQYRFH